MLRMNVKHGLIAAEALKRRIRETSLNSSLTQPGMTSIPSLPSPTIVDKEDREFMY
jgi:hypothetical protein